MKLYAGCDETPSKSIVCFSSNPETLKMKKTFLALICAVSASPALALTINFTGYENDSFFGAEQLDIFNQAAAEYEKLITNDMIIDVTLSTESMSDNILAMGGPSWWVTGQDIAVTNISGGSISFNVGKSGFSNYDLYSITVHELGHVLGIISGFDPWDNLLTGGGAWFSGEYAVGVYGGLVPVTNDESHWDNTRWNSVLNPSMFPSFGPGEIRGPSELDFAALADIGWQVVGFNASMVPEPETWAMLLAGLGIVGSVATRRRHQLA
jgi:hypothetical protein